MQSENNQVAIIENSIEVLKSGPQILLANQTRKDKALSAGRKILSAIQEEGMTAELDEAAMNYLTKINAANKEMKEGRAGVTQIMDALKKMYTEVENEIDTKKAGTVPAQIQSHRDQYAKEQAAIAEQKRKDAELVAAKAKETIEIRSRIEIQLTNFFNDYLLEKKQKFQQGFNNLKLENFADDAAQIRLYAPKYSQQHFATFRPHVFSSLLNNDEIGKVTTEVTDGKYEQFADQYASQMLELKKDIVDKISSKHEELKEQKRIADEAAEAAEAARKADEKRKEEIAKAGAKEKERLEKEAAIEREANEKRQKELKEQQEAAAAEQKRREDQEAIDLQAKADEAKRKAQQESEIKAQGDQTMVMFEQEASLADGAQAPEARQGFEIEVLHPVGFTQIFAVWFDKEGKSLPVDKIGNTKLEQMKSYCEKIAHKEGFFIESKFLNYSETFKAINRKAK
jgi:hypothetical protein